MTRPQADNILDMRREGADIAQHTINMALELTGDLPIAKHEDSDGTGYCSGCGTTIGEQHHDGCDLRCDD